MSIPKSVVPQSLISIFYDPTEEKLYGFGPLNHIETSCSKEELIKEVSIFLRSNCAADYNIFSSDFGVETADFIVVSQGDDYHIGVVAGKNIVYLDVSGYDYVDDLEIIEKLRYLDDDCTLRLVACLKGTDGSYNYVRDIFQGKKQVAEGLYYLNEEEKLKISNYVFSNPFQEEN